MKGARAVLAEALGAIHLADTALDAIDAAGLELTPATKRVLKAEVEEVWHAYLHYHPRSTLTAQRSSLIRRRIRDGYEPAVLIEAIHGNHRSPWHCGANPDGKRYHDLGLILRNADTIERFAGTADSTADKLAAGGKLNARDLARIALEGGDGGDARRIGGFAELVRPQLAAGG